MGFKSDKQRKAMFAKMNKGRSRPLQPELIKKGDIVTVKAFKKTRDNVFKVTSTEKLKNNTFVTVKGFYFQKDLNIRKKHI